MSQPASLLADKIFFVFVTASSARRTWGIWHMLHSDTTTNHTEESRDMHARMRLDGDLLKQMAANGNSELWLLMPLAALPKA